MSDYGNLKNKERELKMEYINRNWHPTNKRVHTDYDKAYAWGSAVVLLLVVVFGGVCITAQMCRVIKARAAISYGK